MSDFDTIEQQLHRVRRRWNLVELQRALYLWVALGAAAATALIVLALATSARLFAALAWSTGAAVVVSGALVAGELRRRWLGAGRSAAWLDRRFALGGRLTSVLEVHRRGERGDAFFLPLLVDQNVQRLGTWQPALAVPRLVPRGALATAITAVGL